MKAMVMAAGVGSRLEPLTYSLPKPLVPVANRPVMEHILKHLKRFKINEVIANVHYLPGRIKDYFADGRAYGVNLVYSDEEVLFGTAGGVKRCQWFLDETFVVVSGDALTDIDLDKLIRFHKEKKALATIALKKVEDVSKYGVVITEKTGRIVSFQEKPAPEDALSNVVNTGIYIFEPEIFAYIPDGTVYDFGKNLFPLLVNSNAPFYGCIVEEYWCDIGSLDTYREANLDVLAGKVNLDILDVQLWKNHLGNGKTIIGEGTVIEPEAQLSGNIIIGPNCVVKKGAVIRDSIIWANTVIEENADISSAIIGSRCTIGKGVVLSPGVIVADGMSLADYQEVSAHTVLGLKTGK